MSVSSRREAKSLRFPLRGENPGLKLTFTHAAACARFVGAGTAPRLAIALGLAGLIGAASAAEVPPPPPAIPSTASSSVGPTLRPVIQHDGQTFALASSTTGPNVETDEYVADGEKIAEWNQLVTVQRLTLAKPAAADEFLAYFQRRIQAEDGASLERLKSGRTATVFAVRFPKSEKNDEQVMICLAFVDPANPALLNIAQYAIKPTRLPVATVEAHLRSWRDQFLRQAGSIGRP